MNCLFRDWQPDADICMKLRDRVRGTTRKLDPVSRQISSVPITASVVSDENMSDSYAWNDGLWMIKRKKEAGKKKPVTVYEVSLTDWLKEKSADESRGIL